jgi:hypothetical protein
MARHWVGVAAAEHVRRGRKAGFMQLCHGKAAPLRRLRPGDVIAYYSPTESFRGHDALQAFTAIGIVRESEPYEFDMSGGFCPFRRDVEWLAAREAPIRPLLPLLDFSAGNKGWGYKLRFGLFEVSEADMQRIAAAMGATV